MEVEGGGFEMQTAKEDLVGLEERRRELLEEKEVMWHLKSTAIWLNCEDENTKFFKPMQEEGNYPTLYGN